MEVSAPKFELVPVREQKDIMLNAAIMNAEQECQRIAELVRVLEKQAQDVWRRLDITKMVHQSRYDFKLYQGQHYWLVNDLRDQLTRLVIHGPDDWSTAAPAHYQYLLKISYLGDNTWQEVK
jgi:hypothetical protein